MFIGYKDGKPVMAQVVGHADSLAECKEVGQQIVSQSLDNPNAPSGAAAVVACVPIPPANTVTQAPPHERPIKPTPEQGVL